jgi:polyisoprenoid-binding protein YceI
MQYANEQSRRAGVALPASGIYTIDPERTSIQFETRHMFGLGGVTGTFAVKSAQVNVGDSPTTSVVSVDVSASSVDTGSGMRDKQVRGKAFLHSERFPVISFRSMAVERVADDWVIPGLLTVKGNEAPLELKVTNVEPVGSAFQFTAEARVDRYAYGVTAMKGMAGRFIDLRITAVAVPDRQG